MSRTVCEKRARIQQSSARRSAAARPFEAVPAGREVALGEAEADGVPDLVGEVAAHLALLVAVADVLAGGGDVDDGEAERVRAVGVHHVDGVGRVVQALGHLAPEVVADDRGEVDVAEGHVAHELESRHDHAGHPEEDDVRPRHQALGGVEPAEVRVVPGPVEDREGPEPGAEPGVEHVLVLAERRARALGADGGSLAGHDGLAAGLAVVGGDPVAPPELAADAPVPDVLHPVHVGLGPALGGGSGCGRPRPPRRRARPAASSSRTTARRAAVPRARPRARSSPPG